MTQSPDSMNSKMQQRVAADRHGPFSERAEPAWSIATGPSAATDYEAVTLVCTMGGQAQVVTFALDALLAQGERVDEVIVLHFSPRADPRVARALAQLATEFAGDRYAGHQCHFRPMPIQARGRVLTDIRNEMEAEITWAAVHALISDLKAQGKRLHLCIAGGRRIMGLLATSAAMLHFGHHDRLWHLYTPREFMERARDGAILHARPQDGVRLIQVPMMPWGAYFPLLRSLARAGPGEVLAVQGQMMGAAERTRCQEVVNALTPRQLDVLRAFATGMSPQDVAEALCITLKTVDSHKTIILAQCRVAWGLPEDARLDYRFLRDRFGCFFGDGAQW